MNFCHSGSGFERHSQSPPPTRKARFVASDDLKKSINWFATFAVILFCELP